MIKFALRCEEAHAFEGWFASNEDFERQKAAGPISCPICGSSAVVKALMAPAVATADDRSQTQVVAGGAAQQEMMAKLKELVTQIRAQSEDVGARFPEEARKIHYGEAPQRGIIGQAKPEDVGALLEEGIAVAPLPVLPEDAN